MGNQTFKVGHYVTPINPVRSYGSVKGGEICKVVHLSKSDNPPWLGFAEHLLRDNDYNHHSPEGFRFATSKELSETLGVKIVGYKVPYDMSSVEYREGDVLTLSNNPDFYSKNKSGRTIPKEIAETWEPVYEETYKKGDWVIVEYSGQLCTGDIIKNKIYTLQVSRWKENGFKTPSGGVADCYDKYVTFNNDTIIFAADENTNFIRRKATPEEVEATLSIKIGPHVAVFRDKEVKIGCGWYQIEDVKACKTVLSLKNADAILFGGHQVSLSDVDKILKRLTNEL